METRVQSPIRDFIYLKITRCPLSVEKIPFAQATFGEINILRISVSGRRGCVGVAAAPRFTLCTFLTRNESDFNEKKTNELSIYYIQSTTDHLCTG
jgi:hypothetical protein